MLHTRMQHTHTHVFITHITITHARAWCAEEQNMVMLSTVHHTPPRLHASSTVDPRGHEQEQEIYIDERTAAAACDSVTQRMLIENFEDFATRSIQLYEKAPLRSRFTTKYRNADGFLEIKVTDDNTCLKYKTKNAADTPKVERLTLAFLKYMAKGEAE